LLSKRLSEPAGETRTHGELHRELGETGPADSKYYVHDYVEVAVRSTGPKLRAASTVMLIYGLFPLQSIMQRTSLEIPFAERTQSDITTTVNGNTQRADILEQAEVWEQ
jgi:hypothetical protein